MSRALLALVVSLAAAVWVQTAAAHVQVTPATAAPGDATLFTVLVPNEGDEPTVQVDLQIPDGVVPFSFEETPGWTRSETRAPDESLDVVSWKGSLPAGEFVRFSFLASTPETEGTISWPAVQSYADGTKVRWIGPPDSETPAAVTAVSADAAAQNAGGEGQAEATTSEPAETSAATTEPAESSDTTTGAETVAAPAGSADDGGSDVVSIVAIALGVALGIFGLWTLWGIRRKRAR